jgi:hypothetical protein
MITELGDIQDVDSNTASDHAFMKAQCQMKGEIEDGGENVDVCHIGANLVSSEEDAEMSEQHVQGAETDDQNEISVNSSPILEGEMSDKLQGYVHKMAQSTKHRHQLTKSKRTTERPARKTLAAC